MSALRFLFLTLLLAVDSVFSAEGQRIRAEAGQNITLPCGAGKGTQITGVWWFRLDLDSIGVLSYINGHFESDGQHPSFRNRVDLQDRQMKDGDASLILKDVKIDDTGTYECQVIQGDDVKTASIHLVVSPPEQTIKAEAGQNVSLPCGAGKEKMIGTMRWFRPDLDPDVVFLYIDGHFESDYQHPSFRNRVDLQDGQMKDGDVSLILKNVTIKDTGTYLCRVYQEGRGQELISTIHLEVYPPPGQRINKTAKAGQDSVTLPCGAGKGKDITAVEWRRPDLGPDYVLLFRGGRLESDRQHLSFRNRVDLQDRQMKDGNASLILKNVKKNDTGTYLCRVSERGGNRGKRAVTETTIHLVVSPPGRGHPGLVLGLVSVLGIVAAVAAVLFLKRKRTPPPPEGAPVQPLV